MNWKNEWKYLLLILSVFLACYYLPVGSVRFDNAILEAFHLVKWYAQEHVLLCLVPAFFIAGAIGVFISQASVMKYLLAVCSCTILPLFAGIYKMGAGLGPASAFLYSGPAINVLAIVLTARILGPEMGTARAVGAVLLSIVIGASMAFIFRKEEQAKMAIQMAMPAEEVKHTLWQTTLYFAAMIGVLVFANWGRPQETTGAWAAIFAAKWQITSIFAAAAWKVGVIAVPVVALAFLFPDQPIIAFTAGFIGLSIFTSTDKGENGAWFASSWTFAKQILPLLLFGVLVAGALLGRVGHEGLIPSEWVAKAVGGNSLLANFFAAFAGAFMYFATLTEVPIIQGLIGSGMGKGPALSLLLAGPALSLPSMLVINTVLGLKKTAVFVSLTIFFSTFCGILYGTYFG